VTDAVAPAYSERLPWHENQWRDIQARIERGTLPHALLLRGPEGLGKLHFAEYLAAALLCLENIDDGAPCGQCRACTLIRAGSHPDLLTLSIPEDKKVIGVDQVRELIDRLAITPQYAPGKVVIISPAHALNHNAANSLLKTLEEPPAGALLLLCSSRPASLPATIRSRCQQLAFQPPAAALAGKWLEKRLPAGDDHEVLLQLAGNAPLTALHFSETGLLTLRETLLGDFELVVMGRASPSTIAEQWLKLGFNESLYCLYSWTVDMIRLALTGDTARLANPDLRQRLARLAEQCDGHRLFRRMDRTVELLKRLDQSLNAQLMLEELLIDWSMK
jgi:DNA polymerase-3 subunit delta'